MLSSSEVKEILQSQLELFRDRTYRTQLESLLIEPLLQMRFCDFDSDPPEEPDCPCWIIARFDDREGIAFSKHCQGKPPRDLCWGLVQLSEDFYDQDSLWSESLEDLWRRFGVIRVSSQQLGG